MAGSSHRSHSRGSDMASDTKWIIGIVVTVALTLAVQSQSFRSEVQADLAALAQRIDTLVYEVAAVKAQHTQP